jgi:hypothetical protein
MAGACLALAAAACCEALSACPHGQFIDVGMEACWDQLRPDGVGAGLVTFPACGVATAIVVWWRGEVVEGCSLVMRASQAENHWGPSFAPRQPCIPSLGHILACHSLAANAWGANRGTSRGPTESSQAVCGPAVSQQSKTLSSPPHHAISEFTYSPLNLRLVRGGIRSIAWAPLAHR